MPTYRKPLNYVRDYPGKNKTIVLLHGFLATKSYWSKIIPTLRENDNRIVAIDLLGFGKSPKPADSAYDYIDHLRHIQETLRVLGVTGEIILVGHSMGALLSMRYAETFPEQVRVVNLLNPPMYADPKQAQSTLRATSTLYSFLLESRYRHLLWILLRHFGPLASHTRHSREGSLKNVIIPATFFDDLHNISQPTLLVVGRKDRSIYTKNLRATTLQSNVTLHVEDSGHHSPITHAASIGQRILT